MTDEDILEQIKDAITEQLDVDREKIKPESTFFEDLEADSLDVVELILTFEEAFKIDISDEDAAEIKSVNDVLEFVKKSS